MERTARVRAIPERHCNSMNRFEPNRWYPAKRSGFGWMVRLPDCERFVSDDGSGGAHLQCRLGEGWNATSETAGRFEIEETTP